MTTHQIGILMNPHLIGYVVVVIGYILLIYHAAQHDLSRAGLLH